MHKLPTCHVLAFLLLALFCTGCNGTKSAWIFVDNGLDVEMDIEVDGASMASISPGSFKKIEVPVGQRHLRVTAGGETIFNGNKRIDASRVVFETQRYLFNPDGKNLYWTYDAKLESERLLSKVIEDINAKKEKTKWFSKLRKQFDVLPDDNWFAVPKGAVVLENAVRDRNNSVASIVLNRVETEHYKFLKSAKRMRSPSEEDLIDLEHVVATSIAN